MIGNLLSERILQSFVSTTVWWVTGKMNALTQGEEIWKSKLL